MKSRRSLRGLLFPLLVLNALCGTPARLAVGQDIPSIFGNPTRGRDVFVEKGCIACHAVRGAGGKTGPDLAAALVGKGIAGVAAALLNHYPKMNAASQHTNVPLPTLAPAEMDDLVAYLLLINFTPEPGSTENGRALFSQKGCTRCHAFVPGGASIGPPLGRATLVAPPISVAQSMWNHGTQMTAKMQELHVPPSKFEGNEMADLLAFLSGAAEPLPASAVHLPGDPVLGGNLFQTKGCAHCHLKRETGEIIGPDLVTGRWYQTATQIAGAMWNHGPAMWARMIEMGVTPPRFEDDEMAHVLAYLYVLHSTGPPGAPARGLQLFQERQCARCHAAGGPGPDLAATERPDTPTHFAAAMWNHAPRMQAFLLDAGIAWPVFVTADITDLLSYLHEQRTQRSRQGLSGEGQ